MQKTTRAGPSPPSARAILDGFVETGRSSSKIRMSSFSLRPPAVGSERTTMHLSLRVVSMAGENVTLRGLTCRGSGATGAGELVAASGQAAPRPWLARSLPRSGSMRSSGARREGRPPGRVAGVRWEQADAEAAVTGSSGGSLRGLRDAALLAVMSDGLLRVSESTAPEGTDLEGAGTRPADPLLDHWKLRSSADQELEQLSCRAAAMGASRPHPRDGPRVRLPDGRWPPGAPRGAPRGGPCARGARRYGILPRRYGIPPA